MSFNKGVSVAAAGGPFNRFKAEMEIDRNKLRFRWCRLSRRASCQSHGRPGHCDVNAAPIMSVASNRIPHATISTALHITI